MIVAPGTDLRLSVKGRSWVNSDGKRNFPSGEVFTGPVENSAEGHIHFTYPVVTQGREVADIRLRFDGGRVVDASASKNEAFIIETLDTDPGARRLGEFAFGTNEAITRWTKNILLDEKMGGTVHMALGAGYPETGSSNLSAIHWDLICDLRGGGEATADGEIVLQNGRLSHLTDADDEGDVMPGHPSDPLTVGGDRKTDGTIDRASPPLFTRGCPSQDADSAANGLSIAPTSSLAETATPEVEKIHGLVDCR